MLDTFRWFMRQFSKLALDPRVGSGPTMIKDKTRAQSARSCLLRRDATQSISAGFAPFWRPASSRLMIVRSCSEMVCPVSLHKACKAKKVALSIRHLRTSVFLFMVSPFVFPCWPLITTSPNMGHVWTNG